MAASSFFVDSFFWITLIAACLFLASYASAKLSGPDILDSLLQMLMPDKPPHSMAKTRSAIIGGLAITTTLSLFYAGIVKHQSCV